MIEPPPAMRCQGVDALKELPPYPLTATVQSCSMLVSDLNHFLDLPDVHGPARRLGQHFGNIVRAATAAHRVGDRWTSALPCRRRPGRRPCPGRITIAVRQPPVPISWCCSACDDEGVISNWENSPYDLRRQRLTAVNHTVHEVVVTDEVAAALRELVLLDPDRERLVFGMGAHRHGAALHASDDDLEELIGSVAAEANHESNRSRQRRLAATYDALDVAARTLNDKVR